MEINKESIKKLRKEMGCKTTLENQKKLGSMVGVAARTVEGWEQGKNPSTSAAILLIELFERHKISH